MKELENKDTSIVWKFPYKEGNASKIIFKCTCGSENDMFDIKRDNVIQQNKDKSWDIVVDTPIESSIVFTCDDCSKSIEIKHRGYTHKEKIEDRNCEINNLLKFN